jgi:hypothetical protein
LSGSPATLQCRSKAKKNAQPQRTQRITKDSRAEDLKH